MVKLDCCFITDVGKVRKNNEDNFYLCGDYKKSMDKTGYIKTDLVYRGGIFAVCDGMGGEEYGEKASLIAVEGLKPFNDTDFNKKYLKYFSSVNKKICNLMDENNGTRSGTTLVLIYIYSNNAICYNIGDSRAYLFRKKKLNRISEDHTRVEQMIRLGVLSPEQALTHKDRHVLTQHLGIYPDELVLSPHISENIELNVNDVFLLCSDGLTDMLSDDEIAGVLDCKLGAKDMAKQLVKKAMEKGGKDNITVGIIKNINTKDPLISRIKDWFI